MERGLLAVPGVLEAMVDWQTGRAEVTYDSSLTTPDEILRANIFTQERVVTTRERIIHHRYKARLEAS